MENTMFSGPQAPSAAPSAAYDFRAYDQVWQRVTPGVDPYAEDAAAPAPAAPTASTVPAVPAQALPTQAVPRQEGGGDLPGADPDPCCMGTSAQDSLEVLEGFIQEELAGSHCCRSLACHVRNQAAARLLHRIGGEKQAAAQEMCGAYYLITGTRYTPSVTMDHMCWESLAQALRACYHQEACAGLNYARAADETTDLCLTKLFQKRSQQSYRLAEDVMDLLGRLLCQTDQRFGWTVR